VVGCGRSLWVGRLGGRAPPGARASIWRLRRSQVSAAASVAVEYAGDKEYGGAGPASMI
jgi:hypothetical protein